MATESTSGGQRTSAAAKKSPAKKSAVKKSAVKRSGTKKTAARSSSPTNGATRGSSGMSAMDAARSAAKQLAELTGRQPECVIGIEPADEGWAVELEVVESRRIPDSTDILATYRVQVDADGELMSYHRAERYVRGKGSGDGGR